jgi:hypothetical protein
MTHEESRENAKDDEDIMNGKDRELLSWTQPTPSRVAPAEHTAKAS